MSKTIQIGAPFDRSKSQEISLEYPNWNVIMKLAFE